MNTSLTSVQRTEGLEKSQPQNNHNNTDVKFGDFLKSSLEKVNEAQNISKEKTNELALGQVDHLHEVMIAAEKASITLETTVQVQRKVIDAYNEIMRMQI